MFVKVSVPASVANDPSCNALLNSAVVPVTVLSPKSIVLLVKVCVDVNNAIALVLDKSVEAIVMFAEPSKL